ncbi:GDP-mannose transporter into the lumen of the Golgi [Podochytrium sp. JEL0797]|nr:GDP-mannose transporter into the lumen of the Golgi [Podochytrium sp. JEL0797]
MTLILIAYGERIFFSGPRVTGLILASFGLMVFSAVMAGWDDAAESPTTALVGVSFFWMAANCLTTAMFSISMKSQIAQIGFKDFDTVYFNQLMILPILVVCSLIFEHGAFENLWWRHQIGLVDEWNGLMCALLVSGVTQFAIAYSSAWCLRVTSSTTLRFAHF